MELIGKPNIKYNCKILHTKHAGFTLIELLVVVIIIGLLLAVIIPRAHRATVDAKYAVIRQYASEIGSYAVQWGQDKLSAQQMHGEIILFDVLTRDIADEQAGISSRPLARRYTGDKNFLQVTSIIANPDEIKNPFNHRSYFNLHNDDYDNQGQTIAPSIKPGLLYLAHGPATVAGTNESHAQNFYFLMTGTPDNNTARWYGNMDTHGEGLRHGIFVVRLP
jgi:prepilin-type N-terminal cleavage/methylation domain-containing protein